MLQTSVRGAILTIDRIENSHLPILKVVGWYLSDEEPIFVIENNKGKKFLPHGFYRIPRNDLKKSGLAKNNYSGFIAEFYVKGPKALFIDHVKMDVKFDDRIGIVEAHYHNLYLEDRVLNRNQIYSYGPPTDVSPTIFEFAKLMKGRVLDFGCGNGDLIERLRKEKIQAFGIELERDVISKTTKKAAKQFIKYYNGTLPLPYDKSSFDYIFTSEVLEHVTDLSGIPEEFYRIAKKGLFVTVPDITAIPIGYQHTVVPWHLLESTHVNFFTVRSLAKLFKGYFTPVQSFRFNNVIINNTLMPGSLAMIFKKD